MGVMVVGMNTYPFNLLRGWKRETNKPCVTVRYFGKTSCVVTFRMGAMLTVIVRRRRKKVDSL